MEPIKKEEVCVSMVKALVFLAPGFEEVETSTVVDVLRRCGVDVTVAGLVPNLVNGSHGMKFAPDKTIENVAVTDFDAVVCPGGPGYENLRKNPKVIAMIQEAFKSNKLVAAICAAPAVLSTAGVLKGKACTIYLGMEDELEKGRGKPKNEIVVVDGNLVTSKGPATALPFALKLAEILTGKKAAEEVRKRMLVDVVLK
jgi:4-methyl-5(b-hydroxyethyl)-thiazole monophosphate biosynthesis